MNRGLVVEGGPPVTVFDAPQGERTKVCLSNVL
jgi:ABC-type histidine transport system ATPase subunit